MIKRFLLIVGLLVLFGSVCVSGEGLLRYIAKEELNSKNVTWWSTSSTCTANSCVFNYAYDARATTGLNISACRTGVLDLKSQVFYISPSYEYYWNTTFFVGDYGDSFEDINYGLGCNIVGYPKSCFVFQGGSAARSDLYYNSSTGSHLLIDGYTKNLEYDLFVRYNNNNVYIYINGSLAYTEEDSSIFGNNMFIINEKGAGGCSTDPDITIWFDNFNISEINQGYIMNFTLRDENTYNPINHTLIYFYLYDSANNLLIAKSSNSSMVSFGNLTFAEYLLIYHDSVYNSRSYKWFQNITYDNRTIYILNTSASIPVSITVYDGLHNTVLTSAGIKVSRSINFSTQTIFDGYTDGTGVAVPYLNTTEVYTITASHSGFNNLTTVINNLQPPYQVNMRLVPEGTGNFSSIYDFFSATYSPSNFLPFVNTTPLIFNITTSSSELMIEYFGLTSNVDGTIYNNHSLNSAGETLSLGIAPHRKNLTIIYYVKIVGFDNLTNVVPYIVYNITQTNQTIIDAANELRNEFSDTERAIIVFITSAFVSISLLVLCVLTGIPIFIAFLGGVPGTIFVFTVFGWVSGWYITVIGLATLLLVLGRGGRPNG